MLFSSDFIPIKYESLFQKNSVSKSNGDAIIVPNSKEVLVNFNFFKNSKLNAAKRIIKPVHGFLKIIAIAMKTRKVFHILLKFFSEIFII
jgi:hypothetical protein